MQPITSCLAATTITDALPHLAGMVMVMVVLSILWGICAATAKLVAIVLPEKPAAAAAPAPASPRPAPSTTPESIPPEIIAVIAAAVAVSTGARCRIVSIKPQSSSWERAGRHAVLGSHRIR